MNTAPRDFLLILAALVAVAAVPLAAAEDRYLGDEVVIEGTNTETDTTYLLVTGPNIPAEGGRLDSPQTAVIDGDPLSFTRTGVEADGRWRYRWQTRGIGLDTGVYVVYAESQPRSRTNMVRGEYGTQSYSFGRSSRTLQTALPTATASHWVTTPPTPPETAPPADTLATATSATSTQGAPGFAIAILASMAAFGVAAILLWRCTRG